MRSCCAYGTIILQARDVCVVMRPPDRGSLALGDQRNAAECWEIVLDNPRRAALLALSRQPMPLRRRELGLENRSARGAYVLLKVEGGPRKLTLLATGSELDLGRRGTDGPAAGERADRRRVDACALIFNEQDAGYQQAVLGDYTPARVAIEAAVQTSWDRYLGLQGRFVGMHGVRRIREDRRGGRARRPGQSEVVYGA